MIDSKYKFLESSFPVNLHGNIMEPAKSFKNLGVTLDADNSMQRDMANYVHPLGGGHIIFAFSGVRRPTWFPDILGNSSCPIFTKFGMQVYWVNSLYGIAFGDDSSIAN